MACSSWEDQPRARAVYIYLWQVRYQVPPRKDHRGVNLISDALPFGRLWYAGPNVVANAIGYAEHRSRSQDAVICVYDDAGNSSRYPWIA
jgi:hypothetical protein